MVRRGECLACGSTDLRTEPDKVALLALSAGEKLRFDLDSSSTDATICAAVICNACGFVALYESK